MILGKNFHCFDFFFLSKISLKNCFIIFWIQSNPLQVVKISILDSHQTGFFLRGQSIILDKNFKFFIVPFWAKQSQKQRLVMFWIGHKHFCITKISIFDSYQVGFFVRGQSMILDKNFKFLLCLYSGKIVLEIAFGNVLDRTQAFLHYKNIDF